MTVDSQDLRALPRHFKLVLCDLWGCVHDGVVASPAAIALLRDWRAQGRHVIFVTNAPRPSSRVQAQLDRLHVPRDAYDLIVSSGDVGIDYIRQHLADEPVAFIGSEADAAALTEAGVRLADGEHEFLVCTGFDPAVGNDIAAYRPRLEAAVRNGSHLLCLNPDLTVTRGGIPEPCAGAFAARYEALGGRVTRFGKPFPAIYDRCLDLARQYWDGVDRSSAIAVGDAVATDLSGAAAAGLPFVFVAGGIEAERFDKVGEEAFFANIEGLTGFKPIACVRQLG